MGKLLLIVLITFGLVSCIHLIDEPPPATSERKAADALERIANVLENPHCLCPQATHDASEVSDAEE